MLKKNWIIAGMISALLIGCANETIKQVPKTNPQWPTNIDVSKNNIEFISQQTLGKLARKWKNNESIVIAHFGDSHIQPGWQVGPLRQFLQNQKSNGGRGLIFPYEIAKTYSQEDYRSNFTGKWRTANSIQQPPKIGVGISGFVAVTEDNEADIQFTFKDSAPQLGKIKVTLLYRAIGGGYQIDLKNGRQNQTAIVMPELSTSKVTLDLGETGRNFSLHLRKYDDSASSFEIHGLILENENTTGLVYHNLGVGGAAFKALLQQKYFDQQFSLLRADLVILDWGTNDILYTNTIAADFEKNVRMTIQKIRQNNPDTAILLTSTQEARYKGRDISVSADFAQLIRQIAKEENVLFYDWYQISGGHKSVEVWKNLGYASKDNIHLNGKGYRIRAELLGNALVSALNSL